MSDPASGQLRLGSDASHGLEAADPGPPREGATFSNAPSALRARAEWSRAEGAAARAARASSKVPAAMRPGALSEVGHMGLLALGADPDSKAPWGQSWISWAAERGCAGLCTALRLSGADVHADHPAALAIESGYFEMAAELIEAGASAWARHERQAPLLHTATQARRVDMVDFLVRHGAPVDERDDMERTALIRAASLSPPRAAAALRLLELGADPEARDFAGLGAADYAEQHGDPALADEIRAAERRASEARQSREAAGDAPAGTARPRL